MTIPLCCSPGTGRPSDAPIPLCDARFYHPRSGSIAGGWFPVISRFGRSNGSNAIGGIRTVVSGSDRVRPRKLRLRLGRDPADDEDPDKPPRMRRATYNRQTRLSSASSPGSTGRAATPPASVAARGGAQHRGDRGAISHDSAVESQYAIDCCTATFQSCLCPLWVNSGPHPFTKPCPLYPRKM